MTMLFEPRHNLETRDYVVQRQKRIWDIIRNPQFNIKTDFDRKVSAYVQHYKIPSILQAKVLKLMTENRIKSIRDAISNSPRIANELNSMELEAGDVIYLPVRKRFEVNSPPYRPNYQHPITVAPVSESNLLTFEVLVFKGNSIMPFYENESFALYTFNNILHAFNATSTSDLLQKTDEWQSHYAALVEASGFSDFVATEPFYSDTINFNNRYYDVRYVPKYDVRSLKRVPRNVTVVDDANFINKCITYRKEFRPTDGKRIDSRYGIIFKTFPFKDGHYIPVDGTRMFYLDVPPVKNESTFVLVDNICGSDDLEAAIMANAELDLEELKSYAIRTNDMNKQGIALLVLRQTVGSFLTIGKLEIELPTFGEVLYWITPSCSITKLILPKTILEDQMSSSLQYSLLVVKTLTMASGSKRDAAFLASSYFIPAIDYTEVFKRLGSDAERYVFMTLLLQQYNSIGAQEYRKRLKPEFSTKSLNVSFSRIYKYNRSIVMKDLSREITDNSVALIRPTDMSARVTCPPSVCMQNYRFVDKNLRMLSEKGEAFMNQQQESAYLALLFASD